MITVTGRHQFLKELSAFLPEKCKGVELGSLRGDFSEMILNAINPRSLFLIDPYETVDDKTYGEELGYLPTAYSTTEDYEYIQNRFSKEIFYGKVTIFKSFSYYIANHFKEGIFDFVYVDSSHLYEDVKKDLEDWWPKIKEGGLMAGHDYKKLDKFGVIEAVDEFKEKYGLEMFLFNNSEGDWALKK